MAPSLPLEMVWVQDMIRHGEAPFLECSGHGDIRFSAFYARIKRRGNVTIETIYQAAKKFPGEIEGSYVTNLYWKQAKGRKPINVEEVRELYSALWDEYINENLHLIPILTAATGLSDKFGQKGHACQATELWRIRNAHLKAT